RSSWSPGTAVASAWWWSCRRSPAPPLDLERTRGRRFRRMPIDHLTFVPVGQIDGRPHVVVDGPAGEGTTLCLSHWPGSPELPPALADDLPRQIALRYHGHRDDLHAPAQLVTNNHYDQDGLVGVFTLVEPEEALRRRDLLVDL